MKNKRNAYLIIILLLISVYGKSQWIAGAIDLKYKAAANKREKEMTQGTIIVSNKPIGEDVTTQGKEPLIIGEKIYCKFILKEILSSYMGADGPNDLRMKPIDINGNTLSIIVSYFKDGKYERKYKFFPEGDDALKNGKIFYLTLGEEVLKSSPGEETASVKNSSAYGEESTRLQMVKEFSELKEGTYPIRIRIWSHSTKGDSKGKESEFPLADMTFNFEKKKDSNIKIGYSFENIVSKMTDNKLKEEILNYIKEHSVGCSNNKKDNVLDLKFLDKDWTIHRNINSGVLMGRKIRVAVLYKLQDGTCKIEAWTAYFAHDGHQFQSTVTDVDGYDMSTEGVITGLCDCK